MVGPATRTNPKLQNNGGAGGNQASRQHRLTKSYNLDSISQRVTNKDKQQRQTLLDGEQRASNGNIIALVCGPLRKKRYINPKIERELVDFKKEIEEKFEKSPLRAFVMPRRSEQSNHERRENKLSPEPSSIFSQSRIQKGRQLAQSTDATAMHNYLHNVHVGGSNPANSNGGSGHPNKTNLSTTRKNAKR